MTENGKQALALADGQTPGLSVEDSIARATIIIFVMAGWSVCFSSAYWLSVSDGGGRKIGKHRQLCRARECGVAGVARQVVEVGVEIVPDISRGWRYA